MSSVSASFLWPSTLLCLAVSIHTGELEGLFSLIFDVLTMKSGKGSTWVPAVADVIRVFLNYGTFCTHMSGLNKPPFQNLYLYQRFHRHNRNIYIPTHSGKTSNSASVIQLWSSFHFFPVARPTLCNSFPDHVKSADSLIKVRLHG